MIYLACPYSHKYEHVQAARAGAASRAAARLMESGQIVFSPITHGHAIALALPVVTLPTDWEFWQASCEAFLAPCSVVFVLGIPGWQDSRGVQAEIKLARDLGKPVFLVEYDRIALFLEPYCPPVSEWRLRDLFPKDAS